MLDYRGGANNDSDPTPSLRIGSEDRKFALNEAWRLAWRRKGLILAIAMSGALLGFVATKTLTPFAIYCVIAGAFCVVRFA